MKYLIWLLALSLSFPAFAQKAKPRILPKKTAKPSPASTAATGPVLVVERTPCHGTCPTYTAVIYADGRVEYEGKRFVTLLGQHTLSLPVATVNQMLAEAKRINFTAFRDQYTGNTADLPATIVTVHPVGQPAKTVHAQEDIPANLESYLQFLNKRIDPLANSLQDK